MDYKKMDECYFDLEKNNISVDDCPYFKNMKSIVYIDDEDKCHIGINRKAMSSEREYFCAVMEESAHYEVGITPSNHLSNDYCDRLIRERNEYKAKKYLIKKLIPRNKFLTAIKNMDVICIDDLADEFSVIPEFIMDAFKIYGLA